MNKDETATRHGAWGGAAVGAVVGILFPPAVIGTAVVGAAVGGVGGHLWRGMSRADVKEFGELIDSGQAALVIVGQSTLQDAIDKAQLKPTNASPSRSTSAPRTSTRRFNKPPKKSTDETLPTIRRRVSRSTADRRRPRGSPLALFGSAA